nr:MAG TPA: tail length tape measure protein [Caudoviricetes sp.]
MARLRATIELATSGFISGINKVLSASDRAAKSVEDVSTAADKVKTSLDKAGKSGKKAKEGFESAGEGAEKARRKVKGLGDEVDKTKTKAEKVAGALGKLFAAKTALDAGGKLLSASDRYMNANTRLGLINKDNAGNVINPNLQNDVYASVQRSRASYESTANGVASLGLNAANAFKDQNELIGFVESINKQFAIGGTEASAAAGAMTQLTQAMGSGALRGDELNSVLEAAPSIARNIEKYMGWAEGSIKSYAEKGALSAEIVKNAQLAAMDDIDRQFNSMPLTWSQLWTQAMNAIQRASAPFLLALNWIANNMDIIGPILLGIAAGLAVYAAFTYGAAAAQWVLNAATGVWNALCMMNPAGLMAIRFIALIAMLYAGTAAFNKLTGASVSATGIIGAAIYVLGAGIYNNFIYPTYSGFAMLANFIGNVFHNPVAAVEVLFLDMANTCISYVLNMARAIENIINKIPGAAVNITSGLDGLKNKIESKTKTIKDESGWKEYVKQPELMDYTAAAGKGYAKGSALAGKVSSLISGGGIGGMNFGNIPAGAGTAGNPAAVKGTGKNGSMNVKLEDEDIDYLRELAERDYVARIAQNTLAPNIQVTFTGDINQEMDYEKIGPAVAQILQDEIDTAPEGLY